MSPGSAGVTFEAEISPGMPVADVVDLARRAERAGFDRLGISDVVFWPDSFLLQGLCAQATSTIGIGSMVTNPYTRHPAVLAGLLSTLQEVSGGRAFLGIGVGAGLEALGIEYPRPVAMLRESIQVIRGLLAGEEVDLRGDEVTVLQSRLIRPVTTPVPISIGTRSPQIMRLAGEVADIALVGARYLSPALATTYRSWLAEGAARAGRTIDDLEVAPRLTLCVSDDGDLARASVKRYVAHYLCLIRPEELDLDPGRLATMEAALERSTGWYFDHDRYDDPAIDTLVSDDLVARFAIAGTPAECVDQMQAVLAMGFTSISMNLAAPRRGTAAEALAETIDGFAQIRASLTS